MQAIQSHYRSPLEVTGGTVERAERSLDTLDAFARRTADLPPAPADVGVLEKFTEYMDNDLQTTEAIALLFETVTRANAAVDNDLVTLFTSSDADWIHRPSIVPVRRNARKRKR